MWKDSLYKGKINTKMGRFAAVLGNEAGLAGGERISREDGWKGECRREALQGCGAQEGAWPLRGAWAPRTVMSRRVA